VQCAEHLRVQAAFDGELDAVSAAAIERHVEHCAECRALIEGLKDTRERMRRDLPYLASPGELRTALSRALDTEAAAEARRTRPPSAWRGRPFWLGTLAGAGAALALSFVVVLLLPLFLTGLPDRLIAAHLESLKGGALTQVVSTDRHTVKPWFAGRVDVSPVVADFSAQGYRLLGGRVDSIDGRRAAVLVYLHGAHVVNVFAFMPPHEALPAQASRRGYHIACWRGGDLSYCAVSDAGWEELATLEGLLAELARSDAR
jgi:anti-sigma factor RsiW